MSFAVSRTKSRQRRSGVADEALSAGAEQSHSAAPRAYFSWHYWPQRLVALLLLAPGLPLIALLVVLVRLTSRGPGIYQQTRVGLKGRHFRLYKLRSMRIDAEAGTGPVWAQLGGDPRITRFGRFLRVTHLDELPQLFNVLKGEMVLVGPRPERPEFTHKLALEIPGYMHRHAVRPGITGLAQINLPPDTDLNSVRRKLVLDLVYIAEGGLWLDLKILACTFARLLCIKGPRITRLFRVERTARLSEAAAPLDRFDDALHGDRLATHDGSAVDLLAKNLHPKVNGHVHKTNGHAGPWSQERSNGHKRPR